MVKKANKRKRYRVRPASKDVLSVMVKTQKGAIPGQVSDLSIEGIAVLFDHRYDPVFALKETVPLELCSKHLPEPIVAPGQVRHREETDRGRIYGFEFIDWPGLLARLPRPLASLFNQRGTYRVQPDPSTPTEVTVEGTLLPAPIQSTLRDLSATGISVQAAYTIENLLMKVELVKVSFRLPYAPTPLTFWGNIMHRDLIGDGISYGILFDQDRTEDFEAKQEVLIKYVAERRQEKEKQQRVAPSPPLMIARRGSQIAD